ncbi:MAG: hypothetical protein QM756_19365 [Polyangiaceae bacterium]
MFVHSAQAQSPTGLDLEWDAPSGCPSREAVLKRLRSIVGASVEQGRPLQAQGRIERNGTRFRLTLRLREGDADTVRVIESNACAELGGAAAVTLGLVMRDGISAGVPAPNGTNNGSSSSSDTGTPATLSSSADGTTTPNKPEPKPDTKVEPPKPEKTAPPADNPPKPPEPTAAPTEAAATHFVLQIPLLGVDVGPLPKPSPTFGLAAIVRHGAWDFGAGARLALAQTIMVDKTPAYGAEVSRLALELRVCRALGLGRFDLAPCVFGAAERLSAQGVGAEVIANTGHQLGLGAGASALARLRLGRSVALVASAGGQVELTRPHAVIEGLGEVTQVAPFALVVNGGLEWAL